MSLLPKTPGVYVQEINTLGSSIVPVSTAIPAFIGYTANHNNSSLADGSTSGVKRPVRIDTLKEFETIFGQISEDISVDVTDVVTSGVTSRTITVNTLTSKNALYYNLQLYFANGGSSCYIVSVGVAGTAPASADFKNGLDEIKLVDEPTLLVFPEAYNLLSTGVSNKYGDVLTAALDQAAELQDRFVIADVSNEIVLKNDEDKDITAFRGLVNSGDSNKYGAIYYPALSTSIKYYFTDDKVELNYDNNGTPSTPMLSDVKIGDNGADLDTGLYNQVLAVLNSEGVVLPASAAVAGVYAEVDRERGVWKAPANLSLAMVNAPTVKLSDLDQSGLNVDATSGISINAIRAFTGKGNIVWGARTMDGNSNEWKYINVRRLFIFIEESIQKAMNPYVFEPNTAQTWLRLKGSIDNFLTGLWRQGALAGAKPDEAFFVNVGLGTTMTSDDILNGIMNIEIGIAAARPAEFIVLKFSQTQQVS